MKKLLAAVLAIAIGTAFFVQLYKGMLILGPSGFGWWVYCAVALFVVVGYCVHALTGWPRDKKPNR